MMFAPEKNFGANFCCDSGKLTSGSNTLSVLFFGYYIKRDKEMARLQVERQDVVLPEKKPFRATSESGEIFFPYFSRGLRHHRYFCVALRGFWAEGGERRDIFSAFYEGLTPPSLFLCRPKGLIYSEERRPRRSSTRRD